MRSFSLYLTLFIFISGTLQNMYKYYSMVMSSLLWCGSSSAVRLNWEQDFLCSQ